jgi:hypothetical protein
LLQYIADILPGCSNAGKVRCNGITFGLDFKHRIKGAVTRRSACAKGNRKEFRVELRQLPARCAQLFNPLRCLRWKKFETESASKLFLGFHLCEVQKVRDGLPTASIASVALNQYRYIPGL